MVCVSENEGAGRPALRGDTAEPVPLSATAIKEHLHALGCICPVTVAAEVDSTNTQLQAAAAANAEVPRALLAEFQTQGRGRRGRIWQAGAGESLLLSLLIAPGRQVAELPGMALAAGAVVAATLSRLGVSGLRLKWPNDLQRDGAKLGGVLIETCTVAGGEPRVVIGLGLNWHLSPATRKTLDLPPADLAGSGIACGDRNELAAELVAALLVMAQRFRSDGLAPFLPVYAAYDGLAGREVDVQSGHAMQRGRALGPASDGALQVELSDGQVCRFHSADVSVRLP